MKKREHKAPVVREVKKGSASELALLCVGAATAAACTGAQVRPVPEPQECPPGAVEVMTDRLGMAIGEEDPFGVALPAYEFKGGGKRKPVPVQEGPFQVEMVAPWDNLPEGSILSGRAVIGPERVYGRFTEALLPGGERLPVCFALVEPGPDKQQGVPIEGPGGPGAVEVYPIAQVRAVRRFE